MGNSAQVKMGVCTVEFNSEDLGYTSGGVKVNYSTDSVEVTVDQEANPVDEILNTASMTVEVPMAEWDLARFANLLPGATLVTDGTDNTKKKLEVSGEGGMSLSSMKGKLVCKPTDGANFNVTVPVAVPVPSMEFSYEKDNVRVYTVTFKALKESGQPLYILGDESATA